MACDSDSERKNDSPNVSFIENCEDPTSWPIVRLGLNFFEQLSEIF